MVYKLRNDRFNFMEFNLSPAEISEKLGDMFILDNSEKWSEFWKPLKGEFFDNSDKGDVIKIPAITLWAGNVIVYNEKAYQVLNDELKPYGEWLPIIVEGIDYWLLHVTNKLAIDAIDVNQSERTVDRAGDVDIHRLVIKPEFSETTLLFKTEYNRFKNIYCTEAFRLLVEKNNIPGLVFSEDLTSSPY